MHNTAPFPAYLCFVVMLDTVNSLEADKKNMQMINTYESSKTQIKNIIIIIKNTKNI
jgi:hypothetical protein